MEEKIKQAWGNLLNHAELRKNLIASSMFIIAFELLKDSVTERPKEFFSDGFEKGTPAVGSEYKEEVLSLNRSPTYASLEWFKKMGAIDEDDISAFTEIKNFRNEIAHKIHYLISEGTLKDPILLFQKISDLLNKLERWWIKEIVIPTNPSFDGKEVTKEEI